MGVKQPLAGTPYVSYSSFVLNFKGSRLHSETFLIRLMLVLLKKELAFFVSDITQRNSKKSRYLSYTKGNRR